MTDWMNAKKPRVNGAALASTPVGTVVTLLGKVATVGQDPGKTLTVQTCDDRTVQVKLDQPLMEPLSGFIEVNGKVLGKNEIFCLNLVALSDETMKNFDTNLYNQILEMCCDA